MIKLDQITKSFEGKVLFLRLCLEIEQGEFVIFSGDSGSGKTTLLNILGGLETVDAGKVYINTMDISKKKNRSKLFSTEIGFLFQNFVLIENKTVRQNLTLIKKRNRSNITVEKALEQVGLLSKIDTKVYKLSGGEQQRVALARLLVKKCTIILADEPTGSLDKRNGDRVLEILFEMQRLGKTIILVTHDESIKQKVQRIVEL
ncbi:ABC transporter ATP-binding protein [Enterococcus phoeniculicola]|uniref:ABC transporter domain-containing protein n=1 Tax=Enterococcus phoeniculicola ATCC BAA-412 TaxID=1158610 RepID=R3WMV5_9ENTE|nr:ATP-binding cassette domain-containing protein [Enterococcus phoeniculicola]EOL43190.1 hypothetical protein UC3_02167 [Enterococcus phoeniculicola ATCC BAA-412]EOT76452.1 hypothetical protein I589_01409 [Enterococcus phoeniculicola ATCC BAA-412]